MIIRFLLTISFILIYINIIRRESRKEKVPSIKIALLTVITSICIVFLLLFKNVEFWIIRVAMTIICSLGVIIWFSPLLLPEIANQLKISFSPRKLADWLSRNKARRMIIESIFIFFYITFGYWAIIFSFDPQLFLIDVPHQFWILPIAVLFSVSNLFSKKRPTKG